MAKDELTMLESRPKWLAVASSDWFAVVGMMVISLGTVETTHWIVGTHPFLLQLAIYSVPWAFVTVPLIYLWLRLHRRWKRMATQPPNAPDGESSSAGNRP
jgi:hypothetical protein